MLPSDSVSSIKMEGSSTRCSELCVHHQGVRRRLEQQGNKTTTYLFEIVTSTLHLRLSNCGNRTRLSTRHLSSFARLKQDSELNRTHSSTDWLLNPPYLEPVTALPKSVISSAGILKRINKNVNHDCETNLTRKEGFIETRLVSRVPPPSLWLVVNGSSIFWTVCCDSPANLLG